MTSGPSGAPGDSAHEAFREHAIHLLRDRPGAGEVVAAGDLALEAGEPGYRVALDLREVLLELRATPPDLCDEVFVRWLDARLAGDDRLAGWDEAAPLLRTALRLAGQAAEAEELGVPWVRREALPFLVETVILPLPAWSAPVTVAMAEAWGMGGAEILGRARENSQARAGEAIHRHDDASGTTWHVDAGDLHGAGRLVLPGFLASFAGKVDGRPVAVVPERGHLHVGGDRSAAMVLWLAAKGRTAFQESPASLSPALYTTGDDDRPVPYHPPGDGRVANEVRLGHLLLASREYAARTADLQRAVGREGLVAGMELALRQADGRPFAWTTYAEGIACYLPPAEAVAVGAPGGPPAGWTTLDALEAAAGTRFRRVVLGGLEYVDARQPLAADALAALRARLSPEPAL